MTPTLRRPSLGEGWRATPAWMRVVLGLVVAVAVAGAIGLLLIGLSPVVWVVTVLVATVVLHAFIGTVTDAFAAPEPERGRKLRSLAVAAALLLMIAAFFAASIVRLGGNVFNRAL